jgi:GNAT superfamily N-acetyltransferase
VNKPRQRIIDNSDRVTGDSVTGDPRSAEVTLRPVGIGDIGWIIHRQALLYTNEYGWNQEFEALLAEIGAQFIRQFKPDCERGWVAVHQGRVAGSVFLVRKSKYVAQLRLLYVESDARGLGIGARLVDECLRSARELGYRRMILWTNAVLASARRIYEARGFELIEEEQHHSFGKDLVGQYWALKL